MRGLIIFALLASARGLLCGTGDPMFMQDVEPTTVPQEYHDSPQRNLACVGSACGQSYGSTYMTVKAANASSLTRPIRIKALWDVIKSGDTPCITLGSGCDPNPSLSCTSQTASCPYMCRSQSAANYYQVSSPAGTYASCESSDIVVQEGNAIYNAMVSRTNQAIQFWQSTLSVKPVLDSITVGSSLPWKVRGTVVTDADLVMVMTSRPSPNSPVAGYAQCLQWDQYHRCTVGTFNWVPEIINTDTESDDVKESEMHTALHEIVHLLGGISPGPHATLTNFIDSSGNPAAPGSIYTVESDPAYTGRSDVPDKSRTLIITPNVVKFTKQYYGCDSAKGFPLEDLPLGKGVHWEARVAGPELMSYGSNSGEVFLSDITLGFLEDTGFYLVDYSKAGSIVTPTTDNTINIGTAKQMAQTGTTTVPTPTPLPVGAQRWGLNGGCAFLNGDPRTSIPAPYTCTTAQDYTCTSDNRMSAVCVIQSTWTVGTTDPQSYGGYHQMQVGDSDTRQGPYAVPSTPESSGQLPKWARFFTSDSEAAEASGVSTATAAQTGGFNNAMDYMPVPVGYWNCAYQKAVANSSNEGGLDLSSFTGTFSSASADMTAFGGQSRCPSCRCLPSSLMELKTLSVNTKFPKYGLCYRTNCPTYNYLQVGIKGQLDGSTYWYGCPSAGGKLYIPGFSGALTCPEASSFCKLEKISGIIYAEQNVLYEALFWGIICGTLVICFFICTVKCLRDRCINCSKRLCGARTFEPPGGHGPVDEDDKSAISLPPVSSRVLCAANTLTLMAGIAIVGVLGYLMKTTKFYTAALNTMGMGIIIVLLSFAGIHSSRAKSVHGPSCWLLTYFFIDLMVTVLLVYFIAYTLGFQNWGSYVSSYYNIIVASGFVAISANATYTENLAVVTAAIKSNMDYMMALSGCVLFVFLVTLVVAGRIMTARVLTSILLTFINNILLAFGGLFFGVGVYIASTNAAALGGMSQIIGYICALGIIFMVVSCVGHFGVARKSFPILMAFIVLALGLLAASASGVWICFNRADYVISWVEAQDDAMLGKLASSLNITLSKAELILKLQGNLQMLGLGFAVMIILQIAAVLLAGLFLYFVKLWKIENGISGPPRKLGDKHAHKIFGRGAVDAAPPADIKGENELRRGEYV